MSLVSRRVGKAAARARPTPNSPRRLRAGPAGIRATGRSTRRRACACCSRARPTAHVLSRRLDQLCSAADVGELVAFYRGLPLYPDPPRHALRAAEGVRSNMRVVFEAVAHRNPYPAEQLRRAGLEPDGAQGAVRRAARLDPIVGLDARANPDAGADALRLRARALGGLRVRSARNCGAASGRSRPVPCSTTSAGCSNAAPRLRSGGGARTARPPTDPGAPALLAAHPALAGAVGAGRLDWESLATRAPDD